MGLFDKIQAAAAKYGIDLSEFKSEFANQSQNAIQPMAAQQAPQQSSITGLYDPKMEKLIDLALADGELTEQEKQVLFKRAESMGIDLEEFEMVLNARLYEHNKAASRQAAAEAAKAPKVSAAAPSSNKFGDVKKCPACGAMIESFTTKCPDCGYELRNIEVSNSVQRFFEMLNELEEQSRETGMLDMFVQNTGMDKLTRRKKALIQNFPVPNTKEDILEFLSLAIPNAKISRWKADPTSVILAPIWKQKCEQIIMKAKFSMKDDRETLAAIAPYAKELKIKFKF